MDAATFRVYLRMAENGRGAYKFTEEVREDYLRLLRNGVRRFAAARQVGVVPQTVQRARKSDAEFDEACVIAELESVEHAEDKLWAAVEAGEPWAIQMVLKARDRDRWGERKGVDVNVSGGVVLELEAGPALERIAALRAALMERAALRGGAVAELEGVVDAEVVD